MDRSAIITRATQYATQLREAAEQASRMVELSGKRTQAAIERGDTLDALAWSCEYRAARERQATFAEAAAAVAETVQALIADSEEDTLLN
jgi:broad specificity polyphosphatase/5'/3'-nucleotidase SurE